MNRFPVWRFIGLIGLLALALPGRSSAQATAPSWWVSRSVVDPLKSPDDYAVLNIGQLKTMARKAKDELNIILPTPAGGTTGAGPGIETLINGWLTSTTGADDYAVANLGQLKTVAKPFWDRLIAEHRAAAYPWTGVSADDFAMANLGQLKTVFNFDGDMDNDGITDLWELRLPSITSLSTLGGTTGGLPSDYDLDGVSDALEFPANTDPTKAAPALTLILPIGATLTP
jgi:hypothetical protein